MKKIEAKKERKRTVIIKAAQDIFRTDGYIGAGMDDIARRSGVTKQTVYRYFSSKEDLFQACLEAQRTETPRTFLDALDQDDPGRALTEFAVGFLNVHMSESHLATTRLLLAEGPTAPEMTRAFFAGGPENTEARLQTFFKDRLSHPDPEYAAKALLSTLLSMRMKVLTGLYPLPTPEEIQLHAQRTVALFLPLPA